MAIAPLPLPTPAGVAARACDRLAEMDGISWAARRPEELHTVSPEFADTLTSLQGRFLDLLGVPGHETVALVLRLGYAAEVTVRSRRLPVPDAETRG